MEEISFIEFMKKYSTVSNDFLDDFLSFYDINTNNSDYIIDLDKVSKWLETRKHRLKDILKKSYKKNIDYKIKKKKTKTKGSGGHNKEIILITPDCFKKICQLTRTKKGDLVREYFLQLEEIVNKYRIYIIDGLRDKIKKLERNQKPYKNRKKGIIYIFRVTDKERDSVYKIGRTVNIKKRLKSHNSSTADNIDVLFIYECDDIKTVEKCVKALMTQYQYRKYKEVYRINIDILKEVIHDCNDMSNKYKKSYMHPNQTGGNLYLSFC